MFAESIFWSFWGAFFKNNFFSAPSQSLTRCDSMWQFFKCIFVCQSLKMLEYIVSHGSWAGCMTNKNYKLWLMKIISAAKSIYGGNSIKECCFRRARPNIALLVKIIERNLNWKIVCLTRDDNSIWVYQIWSGNVMNKLVQWSLRSTLKCLEKFSCVFELSLGVDTFSLG